MNENDIIKKISEKYKINEDQTRCILQMFIDSMKKEVKKTNELHILGLKIKTAQNELENTIDDSDKHVIQVETYILDKITENIYKILKGKNTQNISLPQDYPDNELRQVITYFNQFLDYYDEFAEFMYSIARGELDYLPPKGKMKVVSSFKQLQSNLRHLTYKTQKIANGDFSQKVDFMGDFSESFNKMTLQLKKAFEKIKKQKERILEAYEIIEKEKEKSEKLLLNVLPYKVANDLKYFGKSDPQTFESVSVFFSDIVGFTRMSTDIEPKELITELNEIFTKFDEIMEYNLCDRIKTIGDAYLSVCGMYNNENINHAEHIIKASIDILEYLDNRNSQSKLKWKVRIGIHTGKLVGGIVGIKKYIYDIFGDTINTASRMEAHSEPMKINISEETNQMVKDIFRTIKRPPIEVKGKGKMNMYFIER